MVISTLTRLGSRIGGRLSRFVGSSTARAGAVGATGGAAGGVLLDDVPFIGTTLDPTEGRGGGLAGALTLGAFAALLMGAAWLISEVTD